MVPRGLGRSSTTGPAVVLTCRSACDLLQHLARVLVGGEQLIDLGADLLTGDTRAGTDLDPPTGSWRSREPTSVPLSTRSGRHRGVRGDQAARVARDRLVGIFVR